MTTSANQEQATLQDNQVNLFTVFDHKINKQPLEALAVKIQVVGLSFFYGKKQALDNINLDIPENKITSLIGPSGCGK